MAKDQFKVEPHSFTRKMCNWQFCAKCGLIALKNEFTEWSIRQGCGHKDHPQYQAKRNQYTKLWD